VRSFDAFAGDMPMEESAHLLSGQSGEGCVDGFADTVGDGVAGGCAEEEGCASAQ